MEPNILALDFDGVLCDGLIEYFQTAWKAYCKIWQPTDRTPPVGLAEQFYRLRPVVETGWEMPLVLRSLLLGVPEAEILQNWQAIASQQLAADHVSAADLGSAVDGIRDEWIKADLDEWLAQHRFYPGVIDRLKQAIDSPVYPVIITTKEGRFVRQLLQQQAIELPAAQIFGKETRQPKAQTIRQLIQQFSSSDRPSAVWFVEDRLKTLISIQNQPDLEKVQLFLADWGYNITAERESADRDHSIRLLTLAQFTQTFSAW
jgi:phosphoglycolate phosphatase-like HAD superfamily hydrolase